MKPWFVKDSVCSREQQSIHLIGARGIAYGCWKATRLTWNLKVFWPGSVRGLVVVQRGCSTRLGFGYDRCTVVYDRIRLGIVLVVSTCSYERIGARNNVCSKGSGGRVPLKDNDMVSREGTCIRTSKYRLRDQWISGSDECLICPLKFIGITCGTTPCRSTDPSWSTDPQRYYIRAKFQLVVSFSP